MALAASDHDLAAGRRAPPGLREHQFHDEVRLAATAALSRRCNDADA
jgi:hypothetical protein